MKTSKQQNTTIQLNKEERDRIIAIFERAAHRPESKFNTLADEWDLAYQVKPNDDDRRRVLSDNDDDGFDYNGYNDYDDYDYDDRYDDYSGYGNKSRYETEWIAGDFFPDKNPFKKKTRNRKATQSISGFQSVGDLPQEALDAITLVYKTDDKQLKEYALLLARASLRFFVINRILTYNYDKRALEEFVSAANVVIVEDLPRYDSSKANLVTFFQGRFNKTFNATIQQISQANDSRYYADLGVKIKRAISEMAALGIVNPNPQQLSSYISRSTAVAAIRRKKHDNSYEPNAYEISNYLSTHKSGNTAVVSILNYLKQVKSLESLDQKREGENNAQQGYNSLAVVHGADDTLSDIFLNPEAVAVRNDMAETIRQSIMAMDPLRRHVLLIRLNAMEEMGADMSRADWIKLATNDPFFKSKDLNDTDIGRICSSAEQELSRQFRGEYHNERVVLNGIVSNADWLNEEMESISSAVELMDLDELFGD